MFNVTLVFLIKVVFFDKSWRPHNLCVSCSQHMSKRSNRDRLHQKEKNPWSLGFYIRGDLFDPVQGRGNRWVGWSPDWVEWEDSPDPLHGHTSRFRLLWGMFVRIVLLDWVLVGNKIRHSHILGWECFTVVVPVLWKKGFRCVFLMSPTHGRLFVPPDRS